MHGLAEQLSPKATLEMQNTGTRKIPTAFTYDGARHMILDESVRKQVTEALKGIKPTPETIQMYAAFGLKPTDVGSAHVSWDSWAKEHGGPTVNGVSLSAYDVEQLRKAVREYVNIKKGYSRYLKLPASAVAAFKKVGISPTDLGFIAEDWTKY